MAINHIYLYLFVLSSFYRRLQFGILYGLLWMGDPKVSVVPEGDVIRFQGNVLSCLGT